MLFSNFCDVFDEFESNRKLSKDTRAKRAATKFEPFPREPVSRTDIIVDPPPLEARRPQRHRGGSQPTVSPSSAPPNSGPARPRRPRRRPSASPPDETPSSTPPSCCLPACEDRVEHAVIPAGVTHQEPETVHPRGTESSWSAAPPADWPTGCVDSVGQPTRRLNRNSAWATSEGAGGATRLVGCARQGVVLVVVDQQVRGTFSVLSTKERARRTAEPAPRGGRA